MLSLAAAARTVGCIQAGLLRVSAAMKHGTKLWVGAMATVAALASAAIAATTAEPFALLDRARVEFSATASASLRGGAGEVAVQRYEGEAGGSTSVGTDARLTHGVGWVRTELDRAGANLLPGTLEEVSVRLGWQQTLGPRWRWMAVARPGFYGDGAGLESDTFNVPLLALASYASSRELAWSFGVVANAFSDNPVIPVAGVRWEFAPAWTLNVGLPRAGLEWQANKDVLLTAGATVQGGAYRLTRNPVTGSAAGARLADTKLDYREIRLGVGASWTLRDWLTLSVDAGLAVDQEFDFHQRGVKYRGSDEAFGAVAVSGRF